VYPRPVPVPEPRYRRVDGYGFEKGRLVLFLEKTRCTRRPRTSTRGTRVPATGTSMRRVGYNFEKKNVYPCPPYPCPQRVYPARTRITRRLFSRGTKGVGCRFHVLSCRTRFRRYMRRWDSCSSFALPDWFLAVPRASGLVFMFCGTECVGSHFHVMRSRTRFRRYRRRPFPFSCFALMDSFSAIPRASDPVFMFCAPGLVFDGAECVGSRFHVLRARTCFWRCRLRRVPFSCFPLPNSFYGGTEGVGCRFHVLRARTRFQRYRGRQIPFSCFVLPDTFSAVPTTSGPVFLFCAPKLVYAVPRASSPVFMFCAPGIISAVRERRVPFSCFELLDSFSAVPSASGPVFMFCAPVIVFGGTEASCTFFMFSAPGLIFSGAEFVGSCFHVLRS
jgi:hypothetical protein